MYTPREIVTRQTLTFVESALPEPCARLLEIGCGEGDLALRLAAGGRSVVGLDTSAAAVARARKLGVDAREIDWVEYVDDEPFDVVLFARSLHHMSDLAAAVERTTGFLRPAGRVIVEDFAFSEADAATGEWIRSILLLLQAAGRVSAPAGTQASLLLGAGEPLELWFRDHHHIHSAAAMEMALERHFRILSRVEAPHLYRYLAPCLAPIAEDAGILEQLLEAELRAIAVGIIRPLGRRWVVERRNV